MKIIFEKIITPNFIRTYQGVFKLKELTEKEIDKYIKYWSNNLKAKWRKSK